MPVHLRARLAALAGYPDPGICHSQEIMASRMHCVEGVGQDSATGWLHCVGCRLTSRRCSFLVSKLWRSVLRLRCTSGTMGIPPRPAASRALLGVLRPRRRGCGAQTQVPTRLLPIHTQRGGSTRQACGPRGALAECSCLLQDWSLLQRFAGPASFFTR